jgi:gliding motility-associated-like protein
MKLIRISLLILLFIWNGSIANAQNGCFEIERILVAACAPPIPSSEGYNEMLQFRVGPNPINTSAMQVVWPTTNQANFYPWLGLVQNGITAAKVAEINSTIQACGYLKEPLNQILPANSKVILFTGYQVSATLNSFAQLSDTLYALFQNNTSQTGGHFLNSNTVSTLGTNEQTTVINFGGGCTDQVTYLRSELITTTGVIGNEPGATVLFTDNGSTTYINNGCQAAFSPYNANWVNPGPLCSDNPPINLNTLITGTKGGSWSGPGVTDSILNVAGLSGNITVTYSISPLPNCPNFPAATESKTITIFPQANASWTNPGIICSNVGTFNLNTLITGTTGGSWSGWNVLPNGTWNLTNLTGPFPVSYFVGNGSCRDTLLQTVTLVNAPILNVTGPLTYCVGDQVQPLNTVPATGGSVTWYADSALTQQVATGNSFTPPAADGQFYVVQEVDGCKSQPRALTIQFIDIQIPAGDTLVFYCATGNLPLLNVSSNSTVNWYTDAGLTNLAGTGLIYQTLQGQTVLYAVSETGSCKSEPLKITLTPLGATVAQIIVSPGTSLCLASEIVLKSSGTGSNSWSNGSNADSIIVEEPGTYILTRNGVCNTDADTVVIIGLPVNTQLTASPDTGFAPLNVQVNGSAPNSDECIWYYNDSLIVFSGQGELIFTKSGNYTLKLVCSNNEGCIDSSEVVIVVLDAQLSIEIPNVFTPNGDLVNDIFTVKQNAVKTFSGFIYNRWGKKLYEWTDVTGGWDGKVNGSKAIDGVYFYVIKGTDVKDQEFDFNGTVQIISAE